MLKDFLIFLGKVAVSRAVQCIELTIFKTYQRHTQFTSLRMLGDTILYFTANNDRGPLPDFRLL